MNDIKRHHNHGFFTRLVCSFIVATFSTTTILPPGYAQTIGLSLPVPGTMVPQSPAFVPVLLKGMTVYPDDPLKFEFIIDSGHENFSNDALKEESERLVKYFLASMTVPQDELWVNLSPHEKNRIIPDELGKTELGRDLLAQDYILKQLTATMMYPEEELGKKFWDRIYKVAKDKYGITDIPTDTFNKVWILPERARVYEHENTVYITDAHLKVMLEQDYEAMAQSAYVRRDSSRAVQNEDRSRPVSTIRDSIPDITKQIIREIILPAIEKEVNEGKNFAPLRQIYHSLILAKWYKQTVKNSIMSQVYIDKNKTAGIAIADTQMKEKIYDRYMQAHKKGVFNYIKEDYDELSQTVIPRQYFSGGFKDEAMVVESSKDAIKVARGKVGEEYRVPMEAKPEVSTQEPGSPSARGDGDQAMLGFIRKFIIDGNLKRLKEEDISEYDWRTISIVNGIGREKYVDSVSLNKKLRERKQIIKRLVKLGDGSIIEALVNELTLKKDRLLNTLKTLPETVNMLVVDESHIEDNSYYNGSMSSMQGPTEVIDRHHFAIINNPDIDNCRDIIQEYILEISILKNGTADQSMATSPGGIDMNDKSDHAMISISDEDALAYQQEVVQRYKDFDNQARQFFYSGQAEIKAPKILQESFFHHIPVESSNDIREIYQETQDIVHGVLGVQGIVDMNLDEIHVTIANDDVDSPENFFLTLDDLAKEVSDDVKKIEPFTITLVGPHLMKNGVVVMEYTTSAPEFFYLRRLAEKRINQRKENKELSSTNRAFAPDIIHSTVSDLRSAKGSIPQDKLQVLFERLNQYRKKLDPVPFEVNKLFATHFIEKERRFKKSETIVITGQTKESAGDHARVRKPWMTLDDAREFLTQISRHSQKELVKSIRMLARRGNNDDMKLLEDLLTQMREDLALTPQRIRKDILITAQEDPRFTEQQEAFGRKIYRDFQGKEYGPDAITDTKTVMSDNPLYQKRFVLVQALEEALRQQHIAAALKMVAPVLPLWWVKLSLPATNIVIRRHMERAANGDEDSRRVLVHYGQKALAPIEKRLEFLYDINGVTKPGIRRIEALEDLLDAIKQNRTLETTHYFFHDFHDIERQFEKLLERLHLKVFKKHHSARQELMFFFHSLQNLKALSRDFMRRNQYVNSLAVKGAFEALKALNGEPDPGTIQYLYSIVMNPSQEFDPEKIKKMSSSAGKKEPSLHDSNGDKRSLGSGEQQKPGGIDMNEIPVDRQSATQAGKETHTIQFDMKGMEPLLNMDIQGFSPVIMDMIPINSVLPLLGLLPTEKGIKYGKEEAEAELQVSSI